MVMPFGIGNDTMFQPYTFNLKRFVEKCRKEYDVLPRPHWITTYYGGHVCFSVLISITLINSHFFLWSSIFLIIISKKEEISPHLNIILLLF
jgi:hypothetical protein